MTIALLTAPAPADLSDLADVLVDCVEAGASVGFSRGLDHERALRWWQAALAEPGVRTLVSRDGRGRIRGCVRLCPAGQENGRHRAEVAKLLVHRASRGEGRAGALMRALEEDARALGRTLLVLDTATGSLAERLYVRWGWTPVGVVPGYATTPDGDLAATTVMAKQLAAACA